MGLDVGANDAEDGSGGRASGGDGRKGRASAVRLLAPGAGLAASAGVVMTVWDAGVGGRLVVDFVNGLAGSLAVGRSTFITGFTTAAVLVGFNGSRGARDAAGGVSASGAIIALGIGLATGRAVDFAVGVDVGANVLAVGRAGAGAGFGNGGGSGRTSGL